MPGRGVAFLCWVTPARMSQGAADGPRSRPAPCYGAQRGLQVPAPSFTNCAIPMPQFLDQKNEALIGFLTGGLWGLNEILCVLGLA